MTHINMSEKKITVAIFFHKDIAAHNRKYWIGSVCNDDSHCCETVIKTIAGKGAAAYEQAVKYIDSL